MEARLKTENFCYRVRLRNVKMNALCTSVWFSTEMEMGK